MDNDSGGTASGWRATDERIKAEQDLDDQVAREMNRANRRANAQPFGHKEASTK